MPLLEWLDEKGAAQAGRLPHGRRHLPRCPPKVVSAGDAVWRQGDHRQRADRRVRPGSGDRSRCRVRARRRRLSGCAGTRDRQVVLIGYIGIYPEEHLAPIAAALAATCRATGARVKVVGGLRRPELGELEPFLDWSAWDSTDEASNLADFDIGIMPLADTALHRTKEPLKIKEYMAAGLPIVASPVGHNLRVVREGETGYFAATPQEWESRLSAPRHERLAAGRDGAGRSQPRSRALRPAPPAGGIGGPLPSARRPI